MARERARRPSGVDTASVLAGGRPTVQLNLRMEVTSERVPEMERLLPDEVSEKLVAQQDKVLKWVGANRQNQAAFLTDPVGALEQAGVELGEADRAALRRLHPTRPDTQTLPQGVELASLSVKAGRRATTPGGRVRGGGGGGRER